MKDNFWGAIAGILIIFSMFSFMVAITTRSLTWMAITIIQVFIAIGIIIFLSDRGKG